MIHPGLALGLLETFFDVPPASGDPGQVGGAGPAGSVTGVIGDLLRTPGSAAVVEGHLVAVGVRERESAAERPVDGR
jgi:hypothetical protein